MTRQAASGQRLCIIRNNNLLYSIINSFLNVRIEGSFSKLTQPSALLFLKKSSYHWTWRNIG